MAPTDSRRLDAAQPPAGDRAIPRSGAVPVEDVVPTATRPAPSRVGGREAFSHDPAPRRTQPAASVNSEDFASENYAESTSYTERSYRPLSGAGYRRSRHQAERMRRDLRYGQYLEVPKGQRDIFSSQRRGIRPAVAILIAVVVAIAVAALALALWPR